MRYLGIDKADKMLSFQGLQSIAIYRPVYSVEMAWPRHGRQEGNPEEVTVTLVIFGITEKTYKVC